MTTVLIHATLLFLAVLVVAPTTTPSDPGATLPHAPDTGAPRDERAAPDAVADAAHAIVAALVDGGLTGASAAVVMPDGRIVTATAGLSSADHDTPMTPDDRMLSGSVGKTFVTAVAHRLVADGRLDLDAPVRSYFPAEPEAEWLARVPNARTATTRQLLRHTAGMPRYVYAPGFFAALVDEPDRVWRPADLLAYVFDAPPRFAPGEGFAYADTHYVVVGIVIEEITGEAFYDLARAGFVEPLGLADSVPSDRREVPGLVPGHVVMGRAMGIPERAVVDGRTTYNVQFEWCGGGWANTPRDLALWAARLYGGEALDAPYLDTLLDAVEAPELGPDVRYGLGVMLRDTALGPLRSHDGYMPGYLTSIGHWPDVGISAAIQLNEDDPAAIGRPLVEVLVELASVCRDAAEDS